MSFSGQLTSLPAIPFKYQICTAKHFFWSWPLIEIQACSLLIQPPPTFPHNARNMTHFKNSWFLWCACILILYNQHETVKHTHRWIKLTIQLDASHIGSHEVKVARDQREKEVWCPHAYCSDAFADEDRPLLTFQTFGLMMMMIAFIQRYILRCPADSPRLCCMCDSNEWL